MGFLREISKHYRYQNSEVDFILGLTMCGLIILSLIGYLIWDGIKNGPNTFPDDVPHPLVDYSYPGWKRLADQLGEKGEGIRKIRRKYYGINDVYIKPTDSHNSDKKEDKI